MELCLCGEEPRAIHKCTKCVQDWNDDIGPTFKELYKELFPHITLEKELRTVLRQSVRGVPDTSTAPDYGLRRI